MNREQIIFLNRLKKMNKRELKRFFKENPGYLLVEKYGISRYMLYSRIREKLYGRLQ